jgi:cell division protein FtsW (lipid II flippase)
VTIFTVRAKLNRWHKFFFLYQSWYMVIYVSMILWGIVSVKSPVKDS